MASSNGSSASWAICATWPEAIVTDGIEPLGIGEGPYEGRPNPHAWMSPSDATIYVANIRDALVRYDPENAAIYEANAERYIAEIESAIEPIRARAGWTSRRRGALAGDERGRLFLSGTTISG